MSATQRNGGSRRPRGTGSLYARRDKAGNETWYGKVVRGRPQGQAGNWPQANSRLSRGTDKAPGRSEVARDPASRVGRRGPRT